MPPRGPYIIRDDFSLVPSPNSDPVAVFPPFAYPPADKIFEKKSLLSYL